MFSRKVMLSVVVICIAVAMAACKDDPAGTDENDDDTVNWPAAWQGVWQFHGDGRICDTDTVTQLDDFYDILCEGRPIRDFLVGDEGIPCKITVTSTKVTAHCTFSYTDPESKCKVTESLTMTLNRNSDKLSGVLRYVLTSSNCTVEEGCVEIIVTADRLSNGADECNAPAVARRSLMQMMEKAPGLTRSRAAQRALERWEYDQIR